MAPIHNSMPVVLDPDAWPAWLGETEGSAAALLRPAAEDVLHLWPASTQVNSVRNNGATLLDEIVVEGPSGGLNSA